MELIRRLLEHEDLEEVKVIDSSVRGEKFACYTKARNELGYRVSLGQTRRGAMRERAIEFINQQHGLGPEDDI